jgi:hypothetical protein
MPELTLSSRAGALELFVERVSELDGGRTRVQDRAG